MASHSLDYLPKPPVCWDYGCEPPQQLNFLHLFIFTFIHLFGCIGFEASTMA